MSASSEVGTAKETTETPEPLGAAAVLLEVLLVPLAGFPAILAASPYLIPSSSAARSASTSLPAPMAILSFNAASLALAAAVSIAVVLA